MSTASPKLPDSAVPRLPRGVRLHHCQVRAQWFLLYPERAMRLDAIGAEILAAVDGRRSLAAIAGDLAARFNAPEEQVKADIATFLGALAARRALTLDPPTAA